MSLPTRPTKDVEFASGNSAAIIEPPQPQKDTGWLAQKPPRQYFNWLHNLYWRWQLYLDRRIIRTMPVVTDPGATAANKDYFQRYHFDATAGNQSLTLPDLSGPDGGGVYPDNDLYIEAKKIDASANTVTFTGTVEGEVNPVIEYRYTGRAVYAFNGLWFWAK